MAHPQRHLEPDDAGMLTGVLHYLISIGLAAGSPVPARTPVHAAHDRAAIDRVIRLIVSAEDAKDIGTIRNSTWPDGHFTVGSAGRPRRTYDRKSWANFIFGGLGVNYHSRIVAMKVQILGSRATARVTQRTRRDYAEEFSGITYLSNDNVRLERRRGEWRVLDWESTVRQFGSDAAWHRRHP